MVLEDVTTTTEDGAVEFACIGGMDGWAASLTASSVAEIVAVVDGSCI